jgi:hypothetical protein
MVYGQTVDLQWLQFDMLSHFNLAHCPSAFAIVEFDS